MGAAACVGVVACEGAAASVGASCEGAETSGMGAVEASVGVAIASQPTAQPMLAVSQSAEDPSEPVEPAGVPR